MLKLTSVKLLDNLYKIIDLQLQDLRNNLINKNNNNTCFLTYNFDIERREPRATKQINFE